MAFNGAHDLAIGTSNITVYQNHQTPFPAQILLQAQAVEALHTSATVGYISKCHPTTREKVTEDIVDWVVRAPGAGQGSARRKAILWFSGPAGGGKTSVMRGVVDRCEATGFSTLSFFFSIRGSGVSIVRPFVATIIHQLIALDPVLNPIIYDIIRRRPTIFNESLEFQIERVLVQPLQSPAFRSQSSPPKIVIAIDGLDECRDEQEREDLLNALHSLVTRLPHLIVVVVASRPEFDLRRAFARPKLNDITESIRLHDYDGSNDVRVFVCDEIEDIRQSHPLRGSIPEGYKLEESVQLLVNKSSGNFIIPTIAMKYIRHSRRNPVDSLNIIVGVLKNPSPTSKPFAELDALYAHILHPPETDLSLMKHILHCIIGITAIGGAEWISSSFLDNFLKLPPGTTAATLCDLHSILHIPESEYGKIQLHHKSLDDYLLDPERSSDFFQSPYKTQLDLVTLCATHITHWGNTGAIADWGYIQYSVMCWDKHLESCIDQKPVSATLPDIMDLDPRNAIMLRFIHGLHAFSISNDLAKALHVALCSKRRKRCVRLCQLVTRANDCADQCSAFDRTFWPYDTKGRFEALSRFKSETGLFAPLDPDSRVVFNKYGRAQLIRGGRLVDGGKNGRLDDRDGRAQLDDEVRDSQANTTGGPAGGSGGSAVAGRDGLGRPSNPLPRRESLGIEANASTIPTPNNLPPAASDDKDADVQPKASPNMLPPPSDNNLKADTTGGPAGGSGGSATAAHNALGRPNNLPPRRESSRPEASPSASPPPAPSPPNPVSRPSWWRRFIIRIRRPFRRTRS